jgi:tetratricopeptide (TPR) repeat protein
VKVAAALVGLLLLASSAAAQSEEVKRAQAAYEELDYAGAIAAARAALESPLNRDDQIAVYEVLGFAYGALDSTRQAVDAFRQLIFLDPDREPDVERVSPRITSLYAFALGQVLVVRRLHVDSSRFIAGQGYAPVRFEVTRAARVRTRLVGPGVDVVVDTQTVAGGAPSGFAWKVMVTDSSPLPAGEYELIATAYEGEQNEFATPPLPVRVTHEAQDTVAHLTRLAGYEEQPEMVSPPRDYRPLLLSVLYTGIGVGAYLAAQNSELGTGPRTALITVSVASLGTGLFVSLRKPEPRPSQTNILYNQLLRDLLARQNADITRENAMRRTQVVLTVAPSP